MVDWAKPPGRSTEEAAKAGKALRSRLTRQDQGEWRPWPGRPDPVEVLQRSDAGRLADLLPIRYGRMIESPFTFYRGAAAIMASDLAAARVSGIRAQICGDAHLLNFGGFGTPESRFVFDVNDFDETTLGAWEWDVKRLVTSVVIAGRHLGLEPSDVRAATLECACGYRERIRAFATMPVLEVWYARLDEAKLAEIVGSAQERREYAASIKKAKSESRAHAFPRMAEDVGGDLRIVDDPPLLYHPKETAGFLGMVSTTFAAYRTTLHDDRKRLFDRFALQDAAYKVVGVGSVGTRCLVALFQAGENDAIVLQMKEARASVFQTYADAPEWKNEGDRVVTGQRALQSASDLFLGYGRANDGHDYYIRQLRDMKTSADIDDMSAQALQDYAQFCGWALARAHAKASGCAATIAGYLGRSSAFDDAMLEFAESYAAQNDRDYDALVEAVRAGRVTARKDTGS
ncbi:MAG TPA: DUF2252 domain-containing protein [Candidatus Binatia bacterium]|nr:DUF2252 domain-containing protein [Candidatus Binatia bacterium]